ncbi:MAG TPA: TonB-dependent siderophore receptor [Gammaproteobacteria bacterium]|nr:TonB-dependent siderophore receptor [Gammaproteobacteria bacterium]
MFIRGQKKNRLPSLPAGLLATAVGLALASSQADAQSPAGAAAGTGARGFESARAGAHGTEDGDPESPPEQVIVTGRAPSPPLSDKFTAPLLDTPRSVTVVSAELMRERGATSLVEALRHVPGITFNAGEGGQPAGDNLKIRGFDAGADVFVDGVRDAGSQSRDVFALEEVEIISGPSSAYTGRGSTGGSVNLVTKRPGHDDFLRTDVAAGTDRYARGTLDMNTRFAENGALRLNLLRQDANVPGRDGVSLSHRGFAPSLAFGLGTPTRVYADYYYFRTDDVPDYSLPYSRNASNTAAAGPPVSVDRDNFYGLLDRDFQKTGAELATVSVEHDLGAGLTLRNTTRVGRTSNEYIVTNPDDSRGNVANGFVLRNTKSRNSETTTRANLTSVTGRAEVGSMGHSFSIGAEASEERMYNRGYSVETQFTGNANTAFADSCSAPGAAGAASGYNCTTLDDPNPHDPWTGAISPAANATLAETDTRSLYGFDTVTLDEHWLLNVGLRYDSYDTRQAAGPIDSPTTLVNETSFLNHELGVVYKPTSAGSIYLSTGTSSNPSGNTLGDGTENLSEGNAALDPERTRTYELGVKWQLDDGRLALHSSLFRIDKRNARVAVEPGRDAPQQTIGRQYVDGLELGVSGRVTDRLAIVASYTRLDSKIADDGPIATDEGNEFPNTPRNSASVWATYSVLPSLEVAAGATFVDKRYGNTANTVWVPSYVTYDLAATLTAGSRTRLQLNVHNLTDEVYFTRPYTTHYATLGPGRQAVLTASFEF